MAIKTKSNDELILVTAEVLGKALNLSASRVAQLGREGHIPKSNQDGKWDLVACTSAYIEFKFASEAKNASYWEEKTKLTKHEASLKELQLREREGQLLDANEVAQGWANLVMACRAKMLSLPTKLAFEIASESNPNVCLELLTSSIHEALQELSEPGEEQTAIAH